MCSTKGFFCSVKEILTGNCNDTTDQIPVIIDISIINGVAMELFLTAQAPISIDVDGTTLRVHRVDQILLLLATMWPV